MLLHHLQLTNFRSFLRQELPFSSGITILSGGNAQGKTSLLESLFYCSTFSSELARHDRQLIPFDFQHDPLVVGRIVADFSRQEKAHKLEVRIIQENGRIRKEFLLDSTKTTAQKAIGIFPAVLFIPQMTAILEGAPSDRRRYLNILLSQSIPGYAAGLSDYAKILKQRNALLEMIAERRARADQLDYWDELLAARAALLIHHRALGVEGLFSSARENHQKLTDGKERLALVYQPALDVERLSLPASDISALTSLFSSALQRIRSREIARGKTLMGPHLDDFSILANEVDLSQFGSRGQIRTALLSLKFAEIEWVKEKTHTEPLLLLDETFAELDENRRIYLMDRLRECKQGMLTTADLTHFSPDSIPNHVVWTVKNGVVHRG